MIVTMSAGCSSTDCTTRSIISTTSRDSSDRRGKHDLAKRVTAIDEEPATRNEGVRKPTQRTRTGARLSAVECPDSHCERQVVGLVAGSKDELLACHST